MKSAIVLHRKVRSKNEYQSRQSLKDNLAGYAFISPWIIGFIFFMGGPIIASFVISMMGWNLFTPPKFIGFNNYLKMFTEDALFWQSLKVTFIYSIVSVPLMLVLALMVAMLLNHKMRGISIFRTIYYLPSVVSGVAVALLWKWIYNPEFGIFNYLLSLVGVEGPKWLFDKQWALVAIIIISMWNIGGTMVIFLAGLQDIPKVLYEAAEIDGASTLKKFKVVTLPMLSPVILFNLIIGIINSFQVFTQVKIMTEGGPSDATLVMVMYIYQHGFQYYNMGYASALAVVLFMVVFVISVIQLYLSNRWVYYAGQQGR